jgi:ABC-2 type transport system permease protein
VSEAELRDVLDRGEVLAAVRILPGFGRDVARGRTTAVQVLVDGANSNDAQIVSGYAGRVIGDLARRLAGGAGAPERPVRAETRVWFNPTLESRNYFVPGVIANIVMIMTLMLTAMAIVREKEIGTMEQLMVTPLRAVELILGKTAPFALVGLFNMSLVTGAALAIFGVPLRGSFWLLFGSTLLFLMTTLGAGLFLSTVSHTQQQAMMGTFFFFMPAMMLSGFAFPVRNMPVAVEWLSRLNPLRHFLEIIRGVFLKGVGAEVLWPQMAALAVIGLVVLSASVMRFHKRLD